MSVLGSWVVKFENHWSNQYRHFEIFSFTVHIEHFKPRGNVLSVFVVTKGWRVQQFHHLLLNRINVIVSTFFLKSQKHTEKYNYTKKHHQFLLNAFSYTVQHLRLSHFYILKTLWDKHILFLLQVLPQKNTFKILSFNGDLKLCISCWSAQGPTHNQRHRIQFTSFPHTLQISQNYYDENISSNTAGRGVCKQNLTDADTICILWYNKYDLKDQQIILVLL